MSDKARVYDFEGRAHKVADVPSPTARIFDCGGCKIRVIVAWVPTTWGNETHERRVTVDFSCGVDPFGHSYWQPITASTIGVLPKEAFIKVFRHVCDCAVGYPLVDLEWREEDERDAVLMGP